MTTTQLRKRQLTKRQLKPTAKRRPLISIRHLVNFFFSIYDSLGRLPEDKTTKPHRAFRKLPIITPFPPFIGPSTGEQQNTPGYKPPPPPLPGYKPLQLVLREFDFLRRFKVYNRKFAGSLTRKLLLETNHCHACFLGVD